MLLHIPQVLNGQELQSLHQALVSSLWVDGRASAGPQAVLVKNNAQLAYESEAARSLGLVVLKALERHPGFFPAALPRKTYPPGFNRYGGQANAYGKHVDNAVRVVPDSGLRVRTDISCTLFLSDPASYEGGELVIHEGRSERRVKLPAGDMVLYPGNTVHEVTPVTRGERLASFFWVESMVRSDEQRSLLLEMDMAIMQLRQQFGENPATVALTGTYHNLLRLWAET